MSYFPASAPISYPANHMASASGQSPTNFVLYKPKKVSIVNLPAGLGRLVMDPRYTNIKKMRQILNKLDQYEKHMIGKYENHMAKQFKQAVSQKQTYDKHDPIERMMHQYTKKIMAQQDNMLTHAFEQNRSF